MNEEEYTSAAKCGVPVVCNGVRYKRIVAVRYPIPGEGRVMLELLDKNGVSVTAAQPEAGQPADGQMFEIIRSVIRERK